MPTSSRVKQSVCLGVTIGLVLGGTLLYERVSLPPLLAPAQHDESEVLQELDRSSSTSLTTPPASTAANVSGITVQVDPRTGRLRPPTTKQKRALATAFRQQFSQPSPHTASSYSNGMLSIVVGQSLLNFSVARVTPKGDVEVSCLSGVEDVAALLEEGLPPPLTIASSKEE